jgi:hypothetical protein
MRTSLLLAMLITLAAGVAANIYSIEAQDYYENMDLIVLSPSAGSTLYASKVSVLLLAYMPEFEAATILPKRPWNVNISIVIDDYLIVAPYAMQPNQIVMQPIDVSFLFEYYGISPIKEGPVDLRLSWRQPMSKPEDDLIAHFRIPFDYQPNAPLPQTIPLLGHGPGLSPVTPDIPTPSTTHSTVYRIGMSCYYANNAQPCNITQFARHAKLVLSSAEPVGSSGSSGCPKLMELDDYALNDVTRLLARSLIVRYGEKAGVHSTRNVVSSPVSLAWTAGLSGHRETSGSCEGRSASTLEARVKSGAALRAKLIAESGFVVDERWSGYPKPIPPLPTRYELGALLTAEGKRVGIEIGVQHGFYTEVLLSTWLSAEVVFALDPWESQENYVDYANVNNQDSIFRV